MAKQDVHVCLSFFLPLQALRYTCVYPLYLQFLQATLVALPQSGSGLVCKLAPVQRG